MTDLREPADSGAARESADRFTTWLAGRGLECEMQAEPKRPGAMRWSITRTGSQADEADREAVMLWLANDATLGATTVSPVHDLGEAD